MNTLHTEQIATYLHEISQLDNMEKMNEFLHDFYANQNVFVAFLTGTFEPRLPAQVYDFLVSISAQFFFLIKKENPNLPTISQQTLLACFDANITLGQYLQKKDTPIDAVEYVISSHKHPHLLKMAWWYGVNFLDNTYKSIAKPDNYNTFRFLVFIAFKTLIDACEMQIEGQKG